MSGNVSITWVNPTTRVDGSPTGPFVVQIFQSREGSTDERTLVDERGFDQEPVSTLPDVPGGRWEFRLVWHDTVNEGADSVPVDVVADVPFGALNPGTNVEVSVT